jgi:hypothetical protein
MIVELTREFKHKVYKRALEIYTASTKTYGLCHCINRALFDCCNIAYISLHSNNYYDNLIENYRDINIYHFFDAWPEIAKHKPELTWSSSYWFSFYANGINRRKAILRAAIKETR